MLNNITQKLVLIFIFLLASQSLVYAKIVHKSIISSDIKRNYLLHIPQIYKKQNKTRPLIFVFHGGGSKAENILHYSKFNQLANKENFIVVYPNAIDKNWNDGRGVRKFQSHRENIDDAQFVFDMIKQVKKSYKINKIFITGISNGGMFTQYLAIKYPQHFKAAASVVGGMPKKITWHLKKKQAIPFLLMAGTKDPIMPYNGGGVGFMGFRGKIISMPKTIDLWVQINKTHATPKIVNIIDSNKKDNTRIEKITYGLKGSKSQVVFYKMNGGGHNWPGAKKGLAKFLVGNLPKDIDATKEIWDFFKQY